MEFLKIRTFCMDEEVQYEEKKLNDKALYKYYKINNPKKQSIIAFPDGCLDIQCGIKDNQVIVSVAGSYEHGGVATTSRFEKCFGVKLNPGVVPRFLNGKMEKLIANQIDITAYFDTQELWSLFAPETSDEQRIMFFQKFFLEKSQINELHEIAEYIIDTLNKERGNVNISELVENLGYSHRYSDIVFKNNVGFTIKKYASIFRLQEALQIMIDRSDDIYDRLGYYDQSHFIHDFKKFSSYTPSAFSEVLMDKQVV